jgi:hypothetical protein
MPVCGSRKDASPATGAGTGGTGVGTDAPRQAASPATTAAAAAASQAEPALATTPPTTAAPASAAAPARQAGWESDRDGADGSEALDDMGKGMGMGKGVGKGLGNFRLLHSTTNAVGGEGSFTASGTRA